MTYADITFKDRNAVKAWLQRRRLVRALQFSDVPQNPTVVVDFGAGNGELCKYVAGRFPAAEMTCYEPTPGLMAQARQNLIGLSRVKYCTEVSGILDDSVDLLFCLEVFEHLPQKQTNDALLQIHRVLRIGGLAIFGVPVEIGLPAFYKGIFRMYRRFGAYDALPKNILLASLGVAPTNRPVAEIAPGFDFHFEHLGFDYRKLRQQIQKYFELRQTYSSPFAVCGDWISPEVYFVIEKTS
jgi:SAM-dependent methyltransferase